MLAPIAASFASARRRSGFASLTCRVVRLESLTYVAKFDDNNEQPLVRSCAAATC